ncbi:hypothetical protein CVT26_014535 [Gymnopilus dilepis]|uniref:Uncharacterized protein n=1 Tax=Gymnopilus dilepis TaxID=231916 RepID=A0A409W371_9AGAR|nr:hypothetical protein CVT26_014535 [Gymnopilus dilepis]
MATSSNRFYVDDKLHAETITRQIDKSDGRDSSGVRSVEACIARGFPKILSKALIRKDLLKRTQDYHISESYMKYPEVTDALKAYQRRASNKKGQSANNGYVTKGDQQYSSYLPEQYSQDEQYLQDDQYAQDGQYLQGGQYDQDAQYPSDDQYFPDQQYPSDEQYYSGQQYQSPMSTVDDYSLAQQSAALQPYYPASPHVPRRLRYMAPGQYGYPQGRVLVPVRVYRRVRRCDLDDGRSMAYGHSGF